MLRYWGIWAGVVFVGLVAGCGDGEDVKNEGTNAKKKQQMKVERSLAEQLKDVGEDGIHEIYLRKIKIGDKEAGRISKVRTVTRINLGACEMGDEGLRELAKLPKLEYLRIGSGRVTDEGMRYLAKCRPLRQIHLIGAGITDEGLKHLEGMRWLESLYLDDVDVTDEGLSQLTKKLPELHLHLR